MDNLTHTLIGLAAGEAATRLRACRDPAAAKRTRLLFWAVSAAANNFPDLDVLLAPLTPGRLGYALQHRGYTHTLVFAPLQALLVIMIALGLERAWRRGRRKAARLKPADWRWALGLAAAGLGLHLGFDALNSYGVHPYWPLDRAWRFGDSLFIVEPSLWVAFGAPLAFAAESRAAKGFFAAVVALAVGLAVFTGYVPWQLALAFAFGSLWFVGLASKLGAAARIAAGWAAAAAIVAGFAAVGGHARADVRALAASQLPESRIADVVLSPFPLNPLCWSVIVVDTDRGWYYARRGIYAPAPRLLGAAECPELPRPGAAGAEAAYDLVPTALPQVPRLLWSEQFQAPVSELLRLRDGYCSVDALLRFTRVPAWKKLADGRVRVGDLRFVGAGGRARGRGFATLELPKRGSDDPCPERVPRWGHPRRDLFVGD
ncbi:MAG: metal-dependent hydrolase [Deltaproteobacteria bacterium]|nr:metal-dependent hydrolase [Deltaproteobacteria bacterium]